MAELAAIWMLASVAGFVAGVTLSGRRPKPPILAEDVLEALNEAVYMSDDSPPEGISTDQKNIIRRALERLQELEGEQSPRS